MVQETGWSRYIPSGAGVIAFNDLTEAVAGIEKIAANPAKHGAAAYDIAREYLAPDRVLPAMIDEIYTAKVE